MKLGRIAKVLIIIFIISIFSFGGFGSVLAQTSGGQQQVSNPISIDGLGTALNLGATALPFDNIIYLISKVSTSVIQSITGFFLGVAGSMFDFAIQLTIRDARSTYGIFESQVKDLWRIFRDIGNILIIFSLLYLAIRTIIEGNGFADRRTLSRILIAAVLINFSLFFTKIVFDVSNRVSLEIYNGIGGAGNVDRQGLGYVEDLAKSFGFVTSKEAVGGNIFDNAWFGLKNIASNAWDTTGTILSTARDATPLGLLIPGGDPNKLDNLVTEVWGTIMVSIFALVAGFIFLLGCFMLVLRFLIFILLFIFAPLGLIGSMIPYLNKYLGIWWKHLWKQAIVLPVFMLMFYVAYVFIRGPFAQELNGSHVLIFSEDPSLFTRAIRMNIFFFLAMTMLFLTVYLPMKIGDKASTAAMGGAKTFGRFGANLLARGTAFAGRNTVGAAGRYIADLPNNKKYGGDVSRITGATLKDDFSNWGEVVAGTALRKVIDKGNSIGQKKTYDPRNIKVGKQTLGERFGLGKGVENYETMMKAKIKDLEERGKEQAKRYGWDTKTDAEKDRLVDLKSEKRLLQDELKDLFEGLKTVSAKYGKTSIPATKSKEFIRAKQKEIEDKSVEIGQLEEKGMTAFLARQNTRMGMYARAVKGDIEGIKAIEKVEKERVKKWKSGDEKKFEQMLDKAIKGK